MQIIVFEDEQINRLFPITVGRPAYAMTCGSYRLIDWLDFLKSELGGSLRGIVRPHLMTIQQVDYPQFTAVPATSDGNTLLVNARLVPSLATYETLKQLVAEGRSGTVREGESIAAAFLTRDSVQPPAHADVHKFIEFLHTPGLWKLPVIERSLSLFTWPHDLVRHNLEVISASLAHRIAGGKYREIADGVFAAEGALLGQYCTTDTSRGPVLLDEGATVGPYSFLRGPAYLGPKAKVIEHSAIKDAVSLGHTTKIGGEVEASVVEPYTNKQHHGFLGHSYLGSWINLGAGTCNSDLKNTYGTVKMDYRGESVQTGMQFVGCMMGDYAKSAINTGIFTGKTVGCCSMLYGYVTTNVASFVNYARLFGQVTELPPDVMIATQQRMFARRNVQQRACDAQLIHDMYELTRNERQLAGEPLQL